MRGDDFERLFEDEAQGVFAFLAYRTGDRALAQDLTADTFERAFRARGRYDPRRARAKTWIYAIALNVLRDHLRRELTAHRAAALLAREHETGDGGLDAVAHRDELARALATLSAEEREAVALRFGGDLSGPEMAKALGLPLSTVEGRVYRALRKLRAALADGDVAPTDPPSSS